MRKRCCWLSWCKYTGRRSTAQLTTSDIWGGRLSFLFCCRSPVYSHCISVRSGPPPQRDRSVKLTGSAGALLQPRLTLNIPTPEKNAVCIDCFCCILHSSNALEKFIFYCLLLRCRSLCPSNDPLRCERIHLASGVLEKSSNLVI